MPSLRSPFTCTKMTRKGLLEKQATLESRSLLKVCYSLVQAELEIRSTQNLLLQLLNYLHQSTKGTKRKKRTYVFCLLQVNLIFCHNIKREENLESISLLHLFPITEAVYQFSRIHVPCRYK